MNDKYDFVADTQRRAAAAVDAIVAEELGKRHHEFMISWRTVRRFAFQLFVLSIAAGLGFAIGTQMLNELLLAIWQWRAF